LIGNSGRRSGELTVCQADYRQYVVQRFAGPAYQRAIQSLDDAIERLGRAGYDRVERTSPLAARLRSSAGKRALRLDMSREGKVFGGNYALELSTADPVLPATRGLTARGKGVAQMRGVVFRARRGDEAGTRLAARLAADASLAEALGRVHFERIRVEPDGRPVIRHLGGSVVWMVFPPLVKRIPFVPEQAEATLAAFEAFAVAGRM
jgi:hypothetical protein